MDNSVIEILFRKVARAEPSKEAFGKLVEFPDRDALENFMVDKIHEFLDEGHEPEYYAKLEFSVIAACRVLGAIHSEIAIAPLVDLVGIFFDQVDKEIFASPVEALKEIGHPALEPVYERYLDSRGDDLDSLAWVEILSSLGVRDLRVKTALFEYFTLNPPLAIQFMLHYGDQSFLPLIEQYVETSAAMLNENEIDPFASENPLDDMLIENYLDTRDALVILRNYDSLGKADFSGEVEALDRRLLTHSKFDWYEGRIKPVRNLGPKVGRNEPCPCGSGKKYKDCHGRG